MEVLEKSQCTAADQVRKCRPMMHNKPLIIDYWDTRQLFLQSGSGKLWLPSLNSDSEALSSHPPAEYFDCNGNSLQWCHKFFLFLIFCFHLVPFVFISTYIKMHEMNMDTQFVYEFILIQYRKVADNIKSSSRFNIICSWQLTESQFNISLKVKFSFLKARLHRRLLSRQLDAIFVAAKLHQVSNMFETLAISRRDKSHWKSHLVYTCDFEVASLKPWSQG